MAKFRNLKKFFLCLSVSLLPVTGCNGSGAPEDGGNSPGSSNPGNGSLIFEKAFPSLKFESPLFFTHSGDGSDKVYLVQQTGKIMTFANNASAAQAETFLDISDVVRSGGELGLLGLAFHPDYKNNGYFYINYNRDNPLRTIISRFKAVNNAADRSSEEIVLEFEQPFSNHNGGMIRFGTDGYLYIGVGDGGSGGDPQGHGQNRQTLLGTVLRIDVDNKSGSRNYAIPSDNPFSGNTEGFREEIWAYGLRNPWRFDIDPETGTMWLADVGQNKYEEINIVEKGKNYGWNIMEGSHCYKPSTGCDRAGLELPVAEYDHELGNSVTGGFVYRGQNIPEMKGVYFYGDFGTGRIWTIKNENGKYNNSQLADTDYTISSFGTDQNGELYLTDYGGDIYKLVKK